MMKQVLPLFFLFAINAAVSAQNHIVGMYRLVGVQDMAAAFQFSPDSSFEFYYAYGAVDRWAKGTYTVEGDSIKLHSDKIAGADFEITNQRNSGESYKVVVNDKNQYLSQMVKAIVLSGTSKKEFEANAKGEILIDTKNCDKIFLQHELYPDWPCLIKDSVNTNNYFEVRLKPSLEQVSFKDIWLFKDGRDLRCLPNYFMPFPKIRFVRENK